MTRLTLPILLALLSLFPSLRVAQAETLLLQKHTLFDPSNGNIPSHTVLVPKGWQVEGQAFWAAPTVFRNPPSQQIKVKSAEGFGFQIAPVVKACDYQPTAGGQSYGGSRKPEGQVDMGTLVLYRPDTLEEWRQFYLDKVVGQAQPGVRNLKIMEVFDIPELQKACELMMEPTRQSLAQQKFTMAQIGLQQSLNCRAIGFKFEFDYQGQQMEALEVYIVTTVFTDSRYGRGVDWTIALDVQFYGPRGKLESRLPQLVALANSAREIPGWTRFKMEHMAKIDGIVFRGFAERSRLLYETTRDVMQMRHDSYRRRSAMSDRSHARYIDAIREVEHYPSGGEIYELPSGYNYVYSDGYGNFVLTDDSLFQPNVDLDSPGYWSRVEPQR